MRNQVAPRRNGQTLRMKGITTCTKSRANLTRRSAGGVVAGCADSLMLFFLGSHRRTLQLTRTFAAAALRLSQRAQDRGRL